jgi:hypothetical protein
LLLRRIDQHWLESILQKKKGSNMLPVYYLREYCIYLDILQIDTLKRPTIVDFFKKIVLLGIFFFDLSKMQKVSPPYFFCLPLPTALLIMFSFMTVGALSSIFNTPLRFLGWFVFTAYTGWMMIGTTIIILIFQQNSNGIRFICLLGLIWNFATNIIYILFPVDFSFYVYTFASTILEFDIAVAVVFVINLIPFFFLYQYWAYMRSCEVSFPVDDSSSILELINTYASPQSNQTPILISLA